MSAFVIFNKNRLHNCEIFTKQNFFKISLTDLICFREHIYRGIDTHKFKTKRGIIMKKILKSTAIISVLAIILAGCSEQGNSRVLDIYGSSQSSTQDAAASFAQNRVQSEVNENANNANNANGAPASAPSIIYTDGAESNAPKDFIPEDAYDTFSALAEIVDKSQTVEILEEKIAEYNKIYVSHAISKVEITDNGVPVTSGLLKNGMSIRMIDNVGGITDFAVIRAPKDCIPDDAPLPSKNTHKDEDFPDIIQPKMEEGSFEDSLRYIMLRADTVEELERDINELDTENRVLSIQVTKKSEGGTYTKGGVTVTEGAIEYDMIVSVTYDSETVGLQYYVGHFIDRYYGQIVSTGEFESGIWNAIDTAETVEELKRLIAEYDAYERVDSVNVYADGSMDEEITEGVFTSGMRYYIEYDNHRSNMVGQKA